MELLKEQLYATGAGSGKSHGHEKGPSHMAKHKYNAQDYGRAPRAPLLARSSDTWRVRYDCYVIAERFRSGRHCSQVPWGPNFVQNGDPILSDMGT